MRTFSNPVEKAIVLPLTRSILSSGGIEYVVPDITAALPPALMMTPFASVSDWGMISSDMVFVGSAYVLSSTTTDDKPSEIVWPEMVAWPPGAMVKSEMTRPPLEALVIDLLSMRINLLVGYVGRA